MGRKKGKKKQQEDDFWDTFDPDAPEPEPVAPPPAAEAGEGGEDNNKAADDANSNGNNSKKGGGGKKGKKGKKKKDDFDWDTFDPDAPEPEPVAPPPAKEPEPEPTPEPTPEPKAESPAASTPEPAADDDNDDGDGDDDSTAAKSTKEKKKEKDKKKKDKKDKKDKKGKKDKKAKGGPSKAMIAKIKAEREAAEAAEAERIRLEEEKRKAEEEAEREVERIMKEKEEAREAERLRKEALGIKKLSKAERQRQAANEAYKQQLIEQGVLNIPDDNDSEGGDKKKVVYTKKRKGPRVKRFDMQDLTYSSTAADAWEEASLEVRKLAVQNFIEAAPTMGVSDYAVSMGVEFEDLSEWLEGEEDDETCDAEIKGYLPSAYIEEAADELNSSSELEAWDASLSDSEEGEEEGEESKDDSGDESSDNPENAMRSPICCILGHVDTGKTKLLDKIRRTNVQGGEAGGITQQIGATFFPMESIKQQVERLGLTTQLKLDLPGLLIIDTPGHESFRNLRSRGSNLCDIAILVVDITHLLEPQTIESIELLKKSKTPFVVALNKVDRCNEWVPITTKKDPYAPIQKSLETQKPHTISDFNRRVSDTIVAFAEQSLNAKLYYENKDFRKYVSLVPTSAHTGEGIPDLLLLITQLTQKMMSENLLYIQDLQCTVLEVKKVEGLGTTIDVILVNGVIHESDRIVVCGLDGPIVTHIRALLTPHPMKEIRVKTPYLHFKKVRAAQGIKICAPDLEKAVAGTQLVVCNDDDDLEDAKALAMRDMTDMFDSVDRSGLGVYVKASTLGSMEALLDFLNEMNVPVAQIGLGPVHRKDVMKASTMVERKREYAVILAFDVVITHDAEEEAARAGVRMFRADIIYNLFDAFELYLLEEKQRQKEAMRDQAVFPCILQIVPGCVFNNKDPIVVGVEVVEGVLYEGTPLCVPGKGPGGAGKAALNLGRVESLQVNNEPVEHANVGEQVAVKIASPENVMVGRQFEVEDPIVSKISRRSIDVMKEYFRDDMTKANWKLIQKKLKPLLGVQ